MNETFLLFIGGITMSIFLNSMFQKKRLEFDKLTQEHNNRLTFPEDVSEMVNINYCDDSLSAHTMNIYRPTHNQRTLPVIINVHGGGLVMGNKEFNRFFCAELCKMGHLVFSIEYRLVPEIKVFDQFADVTAAMNFIEHSVMLYGGDPNRIYMVGDSAGAYLIAYTVAMQTSPVLAATANIRPSRLKIRALGLISGMFYTRRFDEIGIFLPKSLYGKEYKSSAFLPFTNPEHPAITSSLPPCFLVTSHNDNLRQYTIDFTDALRRNGTECELLDFPPDKRLTHAFCVFEPTMDESQKVMQALIEFFQKY